jgi:hypothetical protein
MIFNYHFKKLDVAPQVIALVLRYIHIWLRYQYHFTAYGAWVLKPHIADCLQYTHMEEITISSHHIPDIRV